MALATPSDTPEFHLETALCTRNASCFSGSWIMWLPFRVDATCSECLFHTQSYDIVKLKAKLKANRKC